MIIYNFRGQAVGEVEGAVYYTTRKPEHYMVKFNGFGISEHILKELENKGVREIQIVYLGKKRETYIFTLEDYIKSPDTFNYNGDMQRFVSIKKRDIQRKL